MQPCRGGREAEQLEQKVGVCTGQGQGDRGAGGQGGRHQVLAGRPHQELASTVRACRVPRRPCEIGVRFQQGGPLDFPGSMSPVRQRPGGRGADASPRGEAALRGSRGGDTMPQGQRGTA